MIPQPTIHEHINIEKTQPVTREDNRYQDQLFPPREIREVTPNVCVIEKIYHQVADESPVCVESTTNINLTTDDQSYIRNLNRLGTDWQKLDHGWVNECSNLFICNKGLPPPTVTQTEEEILDAKRRVIHVALGYSEESHIQIPVGQSIRLTSVDLDGISIRCEYKHTRCIIAVVPK